MITLLMTFLVVLGYLFIGCALIFIGGKYNSKFLADDDNMPLVVLLFWPFIAIVIIIIVVFNFGQVVGQIIFNAGKNSKK